MSLQLGSLFQHGGDIRFSHCKAGKGGSLALLQGSLHQFMGSLGFEASSSGEGGGLFVGCLLKLSNLGLGFGCWGTVCVGWDSQSTRNRRVRLHFSLKAVLLGGLQGSIPVPTQNQKGKDVLLMTGAMNFSNCRAFGGGAGVAKQIQSEFRVSVWEAIELSTLKVSVDEEMSFLIFFDSIKHTAHRIRFFDLTARCLSSLLPHFYAYSRRVMSWSAKLPHGVKHRHRHIVVIRNHRDPHPVVVVLSCKAAHSL